MTKTVLTTTIALMGVKVKIQEMRNNPLIDKKTLTELENSLNDLNLETEIEEKIISLLNFIDPTAFAVDEEEEEAEEEEKEVEEEEEEESAKKAAPAPQFQSGKGQFGKKPTFVKV